MQVFLDGESSVPLLLQFVLLLDPMDPASRFSGILKILDHERNIVEESSGSWILHIHLAAISVDFRS